MIYVRILLFLLGSLIYALGISVTIKVQHLGIHPWDVLNVGLYNELGLSIGTWNIIVGAILITTSFILDRAYVKAGSLFSAVIIGIFVDFYLWMDILPSATHSWVDIITILIGIAIMGVGGGMYNAAQIGSGPRDGFMLSLSEKLNVSIGRVRIITETIVLIIGLFIGGPVFVFTFVFTFVQSPIFQVTYLKLLDYMNRIERRMQ